LDLKITYLNSYVF
ncbi:hypothetical protein AVEN_73062-1, partial [Araneus ventricosus]